MTKYEALVSWALGEVGYREGANNDNKYGIEYGMNKQPYCLIFVWIAHKRVGVTLPRIASCGSMGDWYLEHKPRCILKKPKLGCFILYKWGHAGIFLGDNGDGTIKTVEANTSAGKSGSQSNGDGVYLRTDRTYSDVRFFIDGIDEPDPPKKQEDYMTRDEILKELGDKWIADYNDLPNWAKPDMRELLDKQIINGGTDYDNNPNDINMLLSDVKTIIAMKRMIDRLK